MTPPTVGCPVILFVDLAYDLGGGQVSLLTMMKELKGRGWKCVLYTPPGSALGSRALQNEFEVANARAYSLFSDLVLKDLKRRPHLLLYAILSTIAEAIRLRQVISKYRPLILHSNSLKASLVCGLVSRIEGLPHVWHDRTQNMNLLYRAASLGAQKIVAVSEWVARKHAGNPKVEVIYNGVDINAYGDTNPDSIRAELGIEPKVFVVGAVSRFTRWKGLDVLVQAFYHVASRYGTKVKLVLLGDEQIERKTGERQRLQTMVQALGITEQVCFTGFRSDVHRCMSAFDVVVIPSVEPEPFGRVAIEAMAAGKPVIASNVGGLPEIVEHEHTGLLVPANNPQELALAIMRLVDDPMLAKSMGTRGRERAVRLFSSDMHGSRMHRLFQSLVGL